jgi:hypothetical protein
MHVKRLAPLALTLLLVVAAVAHAAAPRAGKFRGTSEKGDPMGVRVDAQGNAVDVFLEGVKLKCKDGYSFNTPTGKEHRIKFKLGYPIQDDGFWQVNDDNWDPYGVYLQGHFGPAGGRTTGSFHVSTTISKDHKHRGGFHKAVFCDSGDLDFTLKRKS